MTSTEIDRRRLLVATGALAASAVSTQTLGQQRSSTEGLVENAAGGYRFIPGILAFSEGAVAQPGFAVAHVRFDRFVRLDDCYALVERELQSAGRPMQALCGMELRIERPYSVPEFRALNAGYVGVLRDKWKLFVGGVNPVPRCNLALTIDKAIGPSLYGFSYTVPAAVSYKTFVTAGINDGVLVYGENTFRQIAAGETLVRVPDAPADGDLGEANTRRRLEFILDLTGKRLEQLGVSWSDATQVELYVARPLGDAFEKTVLPRVGGSGQKGIRWHYGLPPFLGPQVEIDVRGFSQEKILRVAA
jgi:hypothetical protein